MASLSDLANGLKVLGEDEIRPVWEVLLAYFTVAGILAGGMVFRTVQPGMNGHCLPNDPANMTRMLTKPQSEFLNAFCVTKYNHTYGSIGACFILVMLAVPFISNMWLMAPSVVNSFRTFTKARKEIESLGITSTKMRKLLEGGNEVADDDKVMTKLHAVRLILWRFDGATNVWKLYFARCGVLSAFLIGAIVGAKYTNDNYFKEEHFTCRVRSEYNPQFKSYICFYHMPRVVRIYFLSGLAILSIQLLVVVAGSWYTGRSTFLESQACFTDRFQSVRTMIQFMKTLSINSGDMSCGAFEEFLDMIMSKDYITSGYRAAIDDNNTESCRLYESILQDPPDLIQR